MIKTFLSSKNDWTVIGIGNEYQGDDQVGLEIIRRLHSKRLKCLDLIESEGDGTELLEIFSQYPNAFIVDAISSGSPPGTVHSLDLSSQIIPLQTCRCSSHQFGVAEAIEIAKTFHILPSRLYLYGIEGKNFDFLADLSLEVKPLIDIVVNQIIEKFNEFTSAKMAVGLTT